MSTKREDFASKGKATMFKGLSENITPISRDTIVALDVAYISGKGYSNKLAENYSENVAVDQKKINRISSNSMTTKKVREH